MYEYQAVAVARFLAGRSRPLPPIEEQKEWERKRVAELVGGKNYYSIAPDYASFFELLRQIAGDPVPGTNGRALPPFDAGLLDIWAAMVKPKIDFWERVRKTAEGEQERNAKRPIRAKL